METQNNICQFCDGELAKKYESMKGYVVGTSYDIFVCSQCNLSVVAPLFSDPNVYGQIYKNVEIIPGYERYARYAKLVKLAKNPLTLLAQSEGAYWSVVESLQSHFPNKHSVNILEVGSGLDYLTYALNKAGYKTKGIDISLDAVEEAKKNYGNYYQTENLFDLSKKSERYDCVIMMEVIEHVENPVDFIKAGLGLLRERGKLIVTTPNKSAAPHGTIWHSDFPPVHLWFLSEDSIRMLAKKLHTNVTLFDFTDYSKLFYSPLYSGTIEEIQKNVPRLQRNGEVVPEMRVSSVKTKIFGLRGRYFLSYLLRRLKKKTVSERATTMCVIFDQTYVSDIRH